VTPVHVVVLAAGKGTRMKSGLPKVLHRVGGRPMVEHVLATARAMSPQTLAVVVGHAGNLLRDALAQPGLTFVVQEPQLGTAHALLTTEPVFESRQGTLVLLSGDVPLLTAGTIRNLLARHAETSAALTVLTANVDNPHGYGRIVAARHCRRECAARVLPARPRADLPRARTDGGGGDSGQSERSPRHQQPQRDGGGQPTDERSQEQGKTVVGAGCEIHSWVRLVDATIGDGAAILNHCVLTNVTVGSGSSVGPFAHLRNETAIGAGAKVGNFVELKKAALGERSKAMHLAYLGDAVIGAGVNIGAGTITCNYDGQKKSTTTIEDGAFIGSDSQLIAPVTIGRDAYVGTGTTIREDVPPGSLAVSAGKQRNIAGWVEQKRKKQ
jgi:bifunctional UDP-N-acetylglucosamine pyrophosphorylase/glucosamine-1-phosphate N-acetyltransferase